jgi:hypothetical protein
VKLLQTIVALTIAVVVYCHSYLAVGTCYGLTNQSELQAIDYEVTTLLASLSTKVVKTESTIGIESPSSEIRDDVSRKLSEIAARSAGARARVIYWLIQTVDDPAARQESPIAFKWITAVKVLGTLKAVEAIDSLIDNLDQSGQNGIVFSAGFAPVVGALANIGPPAVPKLNAALSQARPAIRAEAASALGEIGGDEAIKALDRAATTETDERVLERIKAVLRNLRPSHPEISREASSGACVGGQTVAAIFHIANLDSNPPMLQTACTRAPVEITRMAVRADGSYQVYFRNLDAQRKVIGVSYQVMKLDANKDEEPQFITYFLHGNPVLPGAEMGNRSGSDRIKLDQVETYLVQFNSVKFNDMSEWHFKADCSASQGSMRINCSEPKQ